MSFLAPLFFVGLAAIAVPIFVHLIQRERKDIVEFPSLMFIRRIPYQSVERRRIHNWPLLLLRLAAMALVIAGVLAAVLHDRAATAAVDGDAARARSSSCSTGPPAWATATTGRARRTRRGGSSTDSSGEDRATLVLFDRGVEEDRARDDEPGRARAGHRPGGRVVGSHALRSGACGEAQSLLSRSDRARARRPTSSATSRRPAGSGRRRSSCREGATHHAVSVAEPRHRRTWRVVAGDPARDVLGRRARDDHGRRDQPQREHGDEPAGPARDRRPRRRHARRHASRRMRPAVVTFDAVTVAEANMRGVDSRRDRRARRGTTTSISCSRRAGRCRCSSIHADGAGRSASLFLTTGARPQQDAAVQGRTSCPPRASPPRTLEGRSVVVAQRRRRCPTAAADLLDAVRRAGRRPVHRARRPHARQRHMAAHAWDARRAGRSHRDSGAARSARPDYSHPIFEQFKDPRSGNFANMRFFRYRRLTPWRRTIACSRGSTMAPRPSSSAGSEADASWRSPPRWTASWNDFPAARDVPAAAARDREVPGAVRRPRGMARRSAACSTSPRRSRRSCVQGRRARCPVRDAAVVVVSPVGQQTTLGGEGAPAIELAEQGFYSVRLPGTGDRRPFAVAVNLDPAESDLTRAPADRISGRHRHGPAVRRRSVARTPGADAGRYREAAVAVVVPARRGPVALLVEAVQFPTGFQKAGDPGWGLKAAPAREAVSRL